MSAFCGFAAGYFVKVALRLAALVAGFVFCVLQLLRHRGYIDIHWDRIDADLRAQCDLNNDGTLSWEDLSAESSQWLLVMQTGLPSAMAFGTGLAVGLRS